jgi:hypothetical protein
MIRCLLAIIFCSLIAAEASAKVVVISNRFDEDVRFFVETGGQREQTFRLKPGELVPVPAPDHSRLTFRHDGIEQRYILDTDTAYFFAAGIRGGLELRKIGLKTERPRVVFDDVEIGPKTDRTLAAGKRVTIPVKIYVDDNERRQQKLWEPQLRARIAKASEIIGRYAPVEFKVIGVGSWKSDDRINKFEKSFREFEENVDAKSAQIAIGFTSQYEVVRKGVHLGGTRGPLHSHVLIREWSKYIGEDERLEVLVHELGHVLGAAHSPEPQSVMRPSLGDRQANARDFRIGFDPLNTLAMYLIGQQLQSHRVTRLRDLPMPTRRRLADVYAELAMAMPKDPAALNFLRFLGARVMKIQRKPKPAAD